ncbi:hypothetical protein SAMN05444166_6595 [Singulisphaera sp. GP187]|uniref:hypothetical protein n=1 Tax=Singulisphaera sp. GP187 TaxID=1882752 RepID=UPI000929C21C|nr:hypothetical protein [Singulisphaera sp. GP187]SIO60978.1 hypothetical protein SAMN05444166_6595 [Singulisphaera sp. GP187]
MKSPIATLALAGSLATLTVCAYGQSPKSGLFRSSATPKTGSLPTASASATPTAVANANRAGISAPTDSNIRPANGTTAMTSQEYPEQGDRAKVPLPQGAIEPYLLTKDVGPFMVLARTFRGPDAERSALALVLELRNEHQLPAFILRTKDFPRYSNIRNVPPTAPAGVERARLADPERVRSYDEAAVLVGNEKTQKGSEALLHKVKKIRPKCIDNLPKMYIWQTGLSKAIRTTNPYVPAQNLFPGNNDPFITRMNQGPHSLYNCSANYTLEVANFSGRASFDIAGTQSLGDLGLKKSPLITAAEDAEKMAQALAKSEEIRQLGQPVYVYHDRSSSRVMIGAFNAANDPAAVQLRERLLRLSVPLIQPDPSKGRRKAVTDSMIVPAASLTEVAPLKPN